MPNGVRIEALGLIELRAKLREVKDKAFNDELKKIHKSIAEEILHLAGPNVPVDSGALKRSLRAAGTLKDAIGRVGSASVPYAAIVHWKYGPPFLTDAAGKIEQTVVDRYDSDVADMLDRVIGR